MVRKFWYVMIKSTDKKKVYKEWIKIFKKECKNAIKKFISKNLKSQEKINDRKFKSSKKESRAPAKKAYQYPLFYIKRGQDENYYMRNKDSEWEKINIKNMESYLLESGTPYSIGYHGKDKYAICQYENLSDNGSKLDFENKDQVLKYLAKKQKKLTNGNGLAIEFNDVTFIGGHITIVNK